MSGGSGSGATFGGSGIPWGPPPLVPTGTARALFAAQTGAGAVTDAGDVFPAELRRTLAAHDVGDETMLVAWEVARWAPDAPLADRRALALLVVALSQATEAGSSFLAFDGGTGEAAAGPRLADRLDRLGVGAREREEVQALAARILAGSAPPAVANLFERSAPSPRRRETAATDPAPTRRPFVIEADRLYPERWWALEERLGTLLRARIDRAAAPLPAAAEAALVEIAGETRPLGAEQVAALRAALAEPLTVIAGGPGTGKTSIIVALLRVLARAGLAPDAVALAAPTGRGAQRIKESVDEALAALAAAAAPSSPDLALRARLAGAGPGPTTLHRLIGVRPSRNGLLDPAGPTHHAGWRLPHAVVVVDEASMVDLDMMTALAAAVRDDARLVLLGDPDQLPSVDVGAVFRDLCTAAPRLTRRLSRSYRMDPEQAAGAEILNVATAVRGAGPPPRGLLTTRDRAADLRFRGVEHLTGDHLEGLLERWWRERLLGGEDVARAIAATPMTVDEAGRLQDDAGAVKQVLAVHAGARILCVTRTAGRAASVRAVNGSLHRRVQADAVARGGGNWAARAAILPGEPVMVERNDPARGLSNGDVGVVLRARGPRGGHLGVAFARPEGIVVHPLDDIGGRLALAFALTVHKAQGSEYDQVALILPEVDVPLLTREILYTALTRARTGVVVVGDPALFAVGAARRLERASGLADRLPPP